MFKGPLNQQEIFRSNWFFLSFPNNTADSKFRQSSRMTIAFLWLFWPFPNQQMLPASFPNVRKIRVRNLYKSNFPIFQDNRKINPALQGGPLNNFKAVLLARPKWSMGCFVKCKIQKNPENELKLDKFSVIKHFYLYIKMAPKILRDIEIVNATL